MTFYEYLLAINETLLAAKINDCSKVESLPDLIHNKLTNHLKKYLFLGGMPEVIARYLSTNDIVIARNTQNEILEAYKRDFSKYTKKTQSIKTLEVWQSMPSQLAKENKKIKYSSVQKKVE